MWTTLKKACLKAIIWQQEKGICDLLSENPAHCAFYENRDKIGNRYTEQRTPMRLLWLIFYLFQVARVLVQMDKRKLRDLQDEILQSLESLQ